MLSARLLTLLLTVALVVLIAGLLSVVGGFLIARLASTRAEQRVFGSGATIATRERA